MMNQVSGAEKKPLVKSSRGLFKRPLGKTPRVKNGMHDTNNKTTTKNFLCFH